MRKMLWVLCGLAVAAPTFAAETNPCKRNRDLFMQEAARCGCAEQEAEGKDLTCTDGGMKDLKVTKRFSELVKACHDNCKKGGASSSRTKESKPADKKEAAESVEVPAGKYQCRAADAEGNVIAAAAADTTSLDCLKGLKEKVSAKLCSGAGEQPFLYQTPRSGGRWSDGTKSSVRCK